MTFRKLPGLPPYGPAAITFPSNWGAGAREGLVVEFTPPSGDAWVGNFHPGIGGTDGVLAHPDGENVLVLSSGSLWIVNPTTRIGEQTGWSVTDYWQLTDPDGYLFNNQGISFFRLSSQGVMWRTLRISWDGFSDMRVEGDQLTGTAWTPIDDAWVPFVLNLRTGLFEGGSYNGPEMSIGI